MAEHGARVGTGISGLDKLLDGGLPDKTVTLLSGEPGAGKTLLALSYLAEGIRKGEKCCYISLNEKADDLLRAASGIRSLHGIEKHMGKNFAVETIIMNKDMSLKVFSALVRTAYPKIDRLVVDSVNKLLLGAGSPSEYRILFSELLDNIREVCHSALLICEVEKDGVDSGNGESYDCDGVIRLSFLELEESPKRILSIHKMRYTPIEPRVAHVLTIDSEKIKVTETKVI